MIENENNKIIEEFILDNIDGFVKSQSLLTKKYYFHHIELCIMIYLNIEEFETVINSNYRSNEVQIHNIGYSNWFTIDSPKIANKLKEQLKQEIAEHQEKMRITQNNNELKEKEGKEFFIQKFLVPQREHSVEVIKK